MSRLVPHGLRLRLTAWVAIVLLLTLAVTFVAIYRGTGSELRRQTDRELRTDAAAFARHMSATPAETPRQLAAVAQAYVLAQPFRATSRLLYLTAPGVRTVTNEPELLAIGPADDRESQSQQNAERRLAKAVFAAPRGIKTLRAPDIGGLRLLTRDVTSAGRVVARIGVGEPLANIHAAQAGVARAFLLAGVLALVAALLASYLVGARVTRPLRRMARIAARVDAGDLAPRIHAGGAKDEVRVLADAFDHMLDRLADAFARQRGFASDASHELRTPLTVIRGQLELLAREPDPSSEDVRRVERLVQAEVARMSRLVDELLILAHSDESDLVRVEDVDVRGFVAELWEGLRHTADRRFELSCATGGLLRADPDRLAQALRNLARNAVEHTTPGAGRIRLTVRPAGEGHLRLTVEDDGPGIPADQRDRVFDRFHRTDAARNRAAGGTGLGLAIVQAIVQAHGGSASASESAALGGARIDIELPGFIAAMAPARAPGPASPAVYPPSPVAPPSGIAAAAAPRAASPAPPAQRAASGSPSEQRVPRDGAPATAGKAPANEDFSGGA